MACFLEFTFIVVYTRTHFPFAENNSARKEPKRPPSSETEQLKVKVLSGEYLVFSLVVFTENSKLLVYQIICPFLLFCFLAPSFLSVLSLTGRTSTLSFYLTPSNFKLWPPDTSINSRVSNTLCAYSNSLILLEHRQNVLPICGICNKLSVCKATVTDQERE